MNAINTGSTTDLLQGVEQALHYVVGSLRLSTAGINFDTDGPLLAMENILQRLIILQPFLCADFPEINQVLHSVRALVEDVIALEDETQRQSKCRGRPRIEITEAELLGGVYFTERNGSSIKWGAERKYNIRNRNILDSHMYVAAS